MSRLNESLNRILAWLTINCPAASECITPGLTLEEIIEITQKLPFRLPQEVYDLYQWSRGHSEGIKTQYTYIFGPQGGMVPYSLDSAIEIYSDFEDEDEECAVRYVDKPLFPIFGFEGSYLCVIGNWEYKENSPVVFVSEIAELHIQYTSLTSMMLTLAECYEAGSVSIKENQITDYNTRFFSPIYMKQNSELLDFSIKKLRQGLVMRQSNPILKKGFISEFLGDIAYLDQERRNLPNKQLDIQMLKPLIRAMLDEDETVRNLSREALEQLSDDSIEKIKPLIINILLEDENTGNFSREELSRLNDDLGKKKFSKSYITAFVETIKELHNELEQD